MNNISKYIIITIFSFFIFSSCQKNIILEDIVFDNSILEKININAEKKEIKVSYEASFDEPFIDHVMETSPTNRIKSWIDSNVNTFGTMNRLVIDIQKSSIVRKDIENEIKVAGVAKKQDDYLYELNFEIHFLLYNESDEIISSAKSNIVRSITSNKFISLNERNHILDDLTLNSLKDLSKKSYEMINKYMKDYIL